MIHCLSSVPLISAGSPVLPHTVSSSRCWLLTADRGPPSLAPGDFVSEVLPRLDEKRSHRLSQSSFLHLVLGWVS